MEENKVKFRVLLVKLKGKVHWEDLSIDEKILK